MAPNQRQRNELRILHLDSNLLLIGLNHVMIYIYLSKHTYLQKLKVCKKVYNWCIEIDQACGPQSQMKRWVGDAEKSL